MSGFIPDNGQISALQTCGQRRQWPCFLLCLLSKERRCDSEESEVVWLSFTAEEHFKFAGSQPKDLLLPLQHKLGFYWVSAIVTPRCHLSALCKAIGHVLNGWYRGLIHMSEAGGQEVTNGGFMQRPLTSASTSTWCAQHVNKCTVSPIGRTVSCLMVGNGSLFEIISLHVQLRISQAAIRSTHNCSRDREAVNFRWQTQIWFNFLWLISSIIWKAIIIVIKYWSNLSPCKVRSNLDRNLLIKSLKGLSELSFFPSLANALHRGSDKI